MKTHSSILVWKIPRTEEPGGLQSMGSQLSDRMTTTKKRIALLVCQEKGTQLTGPLKNCSPNLGGFGGSREVADKDQGVCRACPPLIRPQVVS